MDKKYTKEQIFDKLKDILTDDFEIESEKLVPEASLFEDLELDSIDAVDLAVKLQDLLGKRFRQRILSRLRQSAMLLMLSKSCYNEEIKVVITFCRNFIYCFFCFIIARYMF